MIYTNTITNLMIKYDISIYLSIYLYIYKYIYTSYHYQYYSAVPFISCYGGCKLIRFSQFCTHFKLCLKGADQTVGKVQIKLSVSPTEGYDYPKKE